jgi:hypothetical protein
MEIVSYRLLVSKKIIKVTAIISKILYFTLNVNSLKLIYYALVYPYLIYGNLIWGPYIFKNFSPFKRNL